MTQKSFKSTRSHTLFGFGTVDEIGSDCIGSRLEHAYLGLGRLRSLQGKPDSLLTGEGWAGLGDG